MQENKDFSVTFLVDNTPQEVFDAINNVRGWWSEDAEGETDKVGSIFYYHFKDIHRGTFKITELVPAKKVVWHVLQNYFNFVKDSTEWTGSDIVFEVARKGDKTEVNFTHVGLKPAEECYDVCFDSWSFYLKTSLYKLITEGKGEPNQQEKNLNPTVVPQAKH